MKIEKTILKECTVHEDVLCNKCGDSLQSRFDDSIFVGLVEESYSGGFFSNEISDEFHYVFSLCEKCLKNLFESFCIPAGPQRRSRQEDISQQQILKIINKISDSSALTPYMVDEDEVVRAYAKIKYKQLGEKE